MFIWPWQCDHGDYFALHADITVLYVELATLCSQFCLQHNDIALKQQSQCIIITTRTCRRDGWYCMISLGRQHAHSLVSRLGKDWLGIVQYHIKFLNSDCPIIVMAQLVRLCWILDANVWHFLGLAWPRRFYAVQHILPPQHIVIGIVSINHC